MKTTVFFGICMFIAIFAFGQSYSQNSSTNSEIIKVTPPILIGPNDNMVMLPENNCAFLNKYLVNNVKYPEGAIACCFQGTEVVQFTVTPSGDLKNFKILNSVCPKIDEEMIRVLNSTNGMWIPGTNNGKSVEMEKEVSMVFHLEGFHLGSDKEYFTKKAANWYNKGNNALLIQKNPEKALECYNNALKYLPYEKALLYARGMAKYELKDKVGAEQDWNRVNLLVQTGKSETNLQLLTEN